MSAGYTYAAIKEANRRANLINCGARFTNNRYRAGSFQLPGYTPVHVNFKADSAAALTISSFPKNFASVGDGGTWKVAIDGEETAQTATVNAAAGFSKSGKSAALATGANAGPFDFLASGKTFIVAVDGGSNQTVTFSATAGTSVSGASPSTNIASETDTKFKIAVNGGTAQTVTLTLTGLTTGAAIATQMQTAIRALGGDFANVTVAYTTVYTITSARLGTSSSVVITRADDHDICDELKIGQAGGTEAAGTGFCANLAAVTITEVIAALAAEGTGLTGVTPASDAGKLRLQSATLGVASSVAVKDGTANAILGFTDNSTALGKPLIDISAGGATKLKVSVNGDTAEEITLTPTGLDTGAKIATALQTAIQALGGQKAAVTVAYSAASGGSYTITSARLGTSSRVVITNGTATNLADDLMLGTGNGGTETSGTGDCANIAAVTAAEFAAVLAADLEDCVISNPTAASVKITTESVGEGSKIVVSDGTLNTALSTTEAAGKTGGIGLNYDEDMPDENYEVSVNQLLDGSETISTDTYAVGSKTASGFDVYCSTSTSTNHVSVNIINKGALA